MPSRAGIFQRAREQLAQTTEPEPTTAPPIVLEPSAPAAPAWGHVPLMCLIASIGVALVAFANTASAALETWGEAPFWAGLLVIAVPIGLCLFLEAPKRSERIALIVIMGVALYLCKVVHDPLRVTGYDEFLHWRSAEDIVSTGKLFAPNTLLGVSPYYPGLELVADALSQLSGMSIFDAGVISLLAVRVFFVLTLYLLFEVLTKDARIAALAAFIYMLNPKFLYFDSQFAYETLALPLGTMVVYLVARKGYAIRSKQMGLTVLSVIALLAVVATHHVSSGMLAAFLVVWSGVALLLGRRDGHRAPIVRMTLLTFGVIATWTLFVASAVLGYLQPPITGTIVEVLRLIRGDLEARTLFVSRSGDIGPAWERLVGTAAVGVVLLLIPLGLFVVWRRYRSNALMLTLALVACAYPASLAARLTRVGADVSTRLPEFLFLGIGIIVALAVARVTLHGRYAPMRVGIAGVLIAVLLTGGVIVGIPGFVRLPGEYLVSADARSIDGESIGAASWTRTALGPGHRFVADRVNRALLSTYGQQELVITYVERVPVRRLYLSPEIGPREREIVTIADVRYLVVDRRLSTGLPTVGHYFDRGEERDVGIRTVPLSEALLAKFDRMTDVSRIFDGGNIQIYDIVRLRADPPPAASP